jgi:hypothetical protein
MFAFTQNAGIFLSTDAGESWSPINTGLPTLNIRCMLAEGSTLVAGTNSYGVFASTDLGATWSPANTGLTISQTNALAAAGNDIFLACENGIWRWGDLGQLWTPVSEGLEGIPVISLAVDDDHLLAGTSGAGAWVRPLAEIVTSADGSAIPLPGEITLEQNYPNPFNPVTTIVYALPRAERVRLSVYNLLGELVRDLDIGDREAGTHRTTWDASGMPSGVYFCQLQAGGSIVTRAMTLLK